VKLLRSFTASSLRFTSGKGNPDGTPDRLPQFLVGSMAVTA
jgi:hypothetical protein